MWWGLPVWLYVGAIVMAVCVKLWWGSTGRATVIFSYCKAELIGAVRDADIALVPAAPPFEMCLLILCVLPRC